MIDRFTRVHAGQRPSASRDNKIARAVEYLSDARAASRQRAEAPVELVEIYITDVSGTELVGIVGQTSPGGGEQEFDIRLAPELIEADRDGIDFTYTDVNNRNADDGTDSEDQIMWPSFAVGDIIVARRDGEDGVLVDTNRAARAWAVVDAPP